MASAAESGARLFLLVLSPSFPPSPSSSSLVPDPAPVQSLIVELSEQLKQSGLEKSTRSSPSLHLSVSLCRLALKGSWCAGWGRLVKERAALSCPGPRGHVTGPNLNEHYKGSRVLSAGAPRGPPLSACRHPSSREPPRGGGGGDSEIALP